MLVTGRFKYVLMDGEPSVTVRLSSVSLNHFLTASFC